MRLQSPNSLPMNGISDGGAVSEQPQRLVVAVLGAGVDDLSVDPLVRRRLPGQTQILESVRLEDVCGERRRLVRRTASPCRS